MTTPVAKMLPGPTGELEALYCAPPPASQGAKQGATRAIVLCHPHPQYGGSLYDSVLDVIDVVAQREAFATLRFNFRGVGASTGCFDNGIGEVDDALAAIAWMRAAHPNVPVWIAGYSFGANVAWRSLDRAGNVAGAVLVAPPVGLMDFTARPTRVPPLTVIAGDADDYVDAADLARWARTAAPHATVECIPGADHFFSTGRRELAAAIERAVSGG